MKLAILDRDGVINHDSDSYIKSPDEWQAIDGSAEAIARLTQNGYTVVVATNQSGISRGLYDIRTLQAIHQKMNAVVEAAGGRISAIFYCPHANHHHCACRKPADGLFREALRRFNASSKNALSVGDSLRDLQAAKSAGILMPILVRTGKGEKTALDINLPPDTPIYHNLFEVVADWLKNSQDKNPPLANIL